MKMDMDNDEEVRDDLRKLIIEQRDIALATLQNTADTIGELKEKFNAESQGAIDTKLEDICEVQGFVAARFDAMLKFIG